VLKAKAEKVAAEGKAKVSKEYKQINKNYYLTRNI
jgi:hypothetical protein